MRIRPLELDIGQLDIEIGHGPRDIESIAERNRERGDLWHRAVSRRSTPGADSQEY